VLLWAGSVWFQGLHLQRTGPPISWSAPVAGNRAAAFFALWCWIDYHFARQIHGSFHFSSARRIIRRIPSCGLSKGTRAHGTRSPRMPKDELDYRDANGKPIPTHADRIIAKEDGEEITFEPQREMKCIEECGGPEKSPPESGYLAQVVFASGSFSWAACLSALHVNASHCWFKKLISSPSSLAIIRSACVGIACRGIR